MYVRRCRVQRGSLAFAVVAARVLFVESVVSEALKRQVKCIQYTAVSAHDDLPSRLAGGPFVQIINYDSGLNTYAPQRSIPDCTIATAKLQMSGKRGTESHS